MQGGVRMGWRSADTLSKAVRAAMSMIGNVVNARARVACSTRAA